MVVESGGLTVHDGVVVETGDMTVAVGDVNIAAGGLSVQSGIRVTTGGVYVEAGGLSVYDGVVADSDRQGKEDGRVVEYGVMTDEDGGVKCIAGVRTVRSGLYVDTTRSKSKDR